MIISNKNIFALSVNSIREVIILTKINSNYDKNILQHPDWFFPVYECTSREAINNIKVILQNRPDYRLLKHK